MDLVGFSVSLVDGTDQALYHRDHQPREQERGTRKMAHVLGDVLEVTSVLEPRSTGRDCERRARVQLDSWKTEQRESVL